MKRKLYLQTPLKTFNGEVIKLDDKNGQPFTLKHGLLTYLRNAMNMNLSDNEHNDAYVLGILIGQSDNEVELTTAQYDLIKKMADFAKVKGRNGDENIWVTLEIKGQLKDMVDNAENVEEKK